MMRERMPDRVVRPALYGFMTDLEGLLSGSGPPARPSLAAEPRRQQHRRGLSPSKTAARLQQVLGHLERLRRQRRSGLPLGADQRQGRPHRSAARAFGFRSPRRATNRARGCPVCRRRSTRRLSITALRALFRTSTQQLCARSSNAPAKRRKVHHRDPHLSGDRCCWPAGGCWGADRRTAVLKHLLSAWKLPAFFAGLVASTNYALSFVIIQLCHSRWPPTALDDRRRARRSHVTARSLRAPRGPRPGDFDRLLDMIARITRSQMASALATSVR